MTATAIVGAQCGDCGKGSNVDFLAALQKANAVVRFNGGDNAGHTVVVEGKKHKFHIYPSGGLQEDVLNVIAAGVLVNPEKLIEEINGLEDNGYTINLMISDNADIIFPWHKVLDGALERIRDDKKIGTTGRGIGPTAMDTAGRSSAVTIGELVDIEGFMGKIDRVYPMKKLEMEAYEVEMSFTKEQIIDMGFKWRDSLMEYIADTEYEINRMLKRGDKVIFEGAQGTCLDVRFGIRPYVTSSHPTIGGVFVGTGINHKLIDNVIGVAKAYLTRVGEGPLPTELGDYDDIRDEREPSNEEKNIIANQLLTKINSGDATDIEIGRYLRVIGGEYGTTTGRPRRTAWLDIPMIKYSSMINGFDSLIITKLDVLSGIDMIKMATHYIVDGEETDIFKPKLDYLAKAQPVYETFQGWSLLTSEEWREYVLNDSLPSKAEEYVLAIEEMTEVPISIVSVGPDRYDKIVLRSDLL